MIHAIPHLARPKRRAKPAFSLVSDPGLFDRPDRAIAAMRMLLADTKELDDDDRGRWLAQLAERLRADGGTRFWTEENMREYADLVNELLDRIGVGLLAPDGAPSRLGVKATRNAGRRGRYSLFYYQPRRETARHCRRVLPEDLALVPPKPNP